MGGPDGGIDLVLRKSGQDFLVQCKQWRTKAVGVTVVRELYGVVMSRGAAGGFLVTSGQFTADAQRFARESSIELIDGHQLVQMIGGIVGSTEHESPAERSFPAAPVPEADTPHCPRCGGAMVRRKARQSGSEFFGCVGFPRCRGTVSI
jgi:restriction system protein